MRGGGRSCCRGSRPRSRSQPSPVPDPSPGPSPVPGRWPARRFLCCDSKRGAAAGRAGLAPAPGLVPAPGSRSCPGLVPAPGPVIPLGIFPEHTRPAPATQQPRKLSLKIQKELFKQVFVCLCWEAKHKNTSISYLQASSRPEKLSFRDISF